MSRVVKIDRSSSGPGQNFILNFRSTIKNLIFNFSSVVQLSIYNVILNFYIFIFFYAEMSYKHIFLVCIAFATIFLCMISKSHLTYCCERFYMKYIYKNSKNDVRFVKTINIKLKRYS